MDNYGDIHVQGIYNEQKDTIFLYTSQTFNIFIDRFACIVTGSCIYLIKRHLTDLWYGNKIKKIIISRTPNKGLSIIYCFTKVSKVGWCNNNWRLLFLIIYLRYNIKKYCANP